jgi:hydroxyethylthiazole kinase-like uncharacterized protein yjeF
VTPRAGAPSPPAARSTLFPPIALLPLPRVTTADESSALDRETIARGTPSFTLMERAGARAADLIRERFPDRVADDVTIVCGPGTNGGEGWIFALALAHAGARVRVAATAPPGTDDARRARADAESVVEHIALDAVVNREGGSLIIDAVLGTGSRGEPRGAVAAAISCLVRARESGNTVVSLDVPSGLDATTGQSTVAVRADLTIAFGTMKRGLLIARGLAGRVVLLDIGLLAGNDDASIREHASPYPLLIDDRAVSRWVPPIAAGAHKGTRKKMVIVGGGRGMAGAPILAARAAMRSGIGMVRALVAPENLSIVQSREPHALAGTWDDAGESDADVQESVASWADVVLIGPGLGHDRAQRELTERLLRVWRGPVVLDADALNVFDNDVAALASLLGGRPAIITPHPAELGRLVACPVSAVLERRFEIGAELARALKAVVLLKGVPTVVSDGSGARLVSAAGTPALAAAGSGDMLSGIVTTLLVQMESPLRAAACAAWVHGRAAEVAGVGHALRGIALDDVERALADSWPREDAVLRSPLLAELEEVNDR